MTGSHAPLLYPLVAEAARRVGANAVGLVDVGCAAGLSLALDCVRIAYDTGQVLGDPTSPVEVTARVKGRTLLPTTTVPAVVARVGLDRAPLEADPDGSVALTRENPPTLLRGDAVEALPEALALVPEDALPVVSTTWTLSHLSREKRLRFLQALDAAARPLAWVPAEGVGVAPAVPTFGDRPASGHSILGLALFDHSTLHVEAMGRCWSQGRMLSWLGPTPGVNTA